MSRTKQARAAAMSETLAVLIEPSSGEREAGTGYEVELAEFSGYSQLMLFETQTGDGIGIDGDEV